MIANFDAVKHGPAIWKLQGLKWREADMAEAKIFQGWPYIKLAATLGLEIHEVYDILKPPAPDRAPAPTGFVDRLTASARGEIRMPVVGLQLEARLWLTLFPLEKGGFTPMHKEAARQEFNPISAGHEAEVVGVSGENQTGKVLILMGRGQHNSPPRLVICPLTHFARYFTPISGQQEYL